MIPREISPAEASGMHPVGFRGMREKTQSVSFGH